MIDTTKQRQSQPLVQEGRSDDSRHILEYSNLYTGGRQAKESGLQK